MFQYLILIVLLVAPLKLQNREFLTQFSLLKQNRLLKTEHQSWGTCWCFSTTTSMQSSMLTQHPSETVNLSEYHIDKYNGFNRHGMQARSYDEFSGQGPQFIGSNSDDPFNGIMVHQGGNFIMSMAYLSNNGGAVKQKHTLNSNHQEFTKFGNTPNEGILKKSKITYLPHNINLLTSSSNKQQRMFYIKHAIMTRGAVSSSQRSQVTPFGYHIDNLEVHYYNGAKRANHAINLIGWDDSVEVRGHKGAWLAQDSWHQDEPSQQYIEHFYVLYDDVHTAAQGIGGGVSFTDVYPHYFQKIYNYALHGWMYTLHDNSITKIKNRYTIKSGENITGVGIYTAEQDTQVSVTLYQDNKIIRSRNLYYKFPGFHYIKIDPFTMPTSKDVEIVQNNNNNYYAYDASGYIYASLGEEDWEADPPPVLIHSRAKKNQSFYFQNGHWHDFSRYISPTNGQLKVEDNFKNRTANFPLILYTSDDE